MYAQRKGWPLAGIRVDVQHDRIHAQDCADCDTRESQVDRFRRVLHVEGDLDDAQRQRLLEIAEKCPVHRTLENEIVIETELAAAGEA